TTNGGSIMGLTPGKGGPVEAVSSAYGPSATSDGRTIVFGGVSDVGLWKMDSASRGKTLQLVSGLMLASIVTPDSRHVVFLSVRSGVQSPWIVPIEGGEPTQITNTFAGIGTLDISPDGRRLLLTTSEQNQVRIMVCDLPTCANPTRLTPAPNYGLP